MEPKEANQTQKRPSKTATMEQAKKRDFVFWGKSFFSTKSFSCSICAKIFVGIFCGIVLFSEIVISAE
jgi:hypothetical protein